MAKRRQVRKSAPLKAESAYERRIERYLKSHPGATRQEARGHRLPAGTRSEYQRRIAGTAPGSEERAMAAGKRGYSALLRGIREGSIVGIDPVESVRNSKGQWTTVYVTVLDVYGNEKTFRMSQRQLTDEKIQQLIDRIIEQGAISSPSYPIHSLGGKDVEADDDFETFELEETG